MLKTWKSKFVMSRLKWNKELNRIEYSRLVGTGLILAMQDSNRPVYWDATCAAVYTCPTHMHMGSQPESLIMQSSIWIGNLFSVLIVISNRDEKLLFAARGNLKSNQDAANEWTMVKSGSVRIQLLVAYIETNELFICGCVYFLIRYVQKLN